MLLSSNHIECVKQEVSEKIGYILGTTDINKKHDTPLKPMIDDQLTIVCEIETDQAVVIHKIPNCKYSKVMEKRLL
jgi:hypothetical protein